MGKEKCITRENVTTQCNKYCTRERQARCVGRGGGLWTLPKGASRKLPQEGTFGRTLQHEADVTGREQKKAMTSRKGICWSAEMGKFMCNVGTFWENLGQAVSGERLRKWVRWGRQDPNHGAAGIPGSSWTPPAGERKPLAHSNQNSGLASLCLQRLDWSPVWRGSWGANGQG